MKIHPNSWHFKFNKHMKTHTAYQLLGYQDGTPNLCRYFWGTVGNLCMLVFSMGMIGMCVLAPFFVKTDPEIFVPFLAADIIFGSVGLFAFIGLAMRKFLKKEPGLIRSYLKARKSKVCPVLELDK